MPNPRGFIRTPHGVIHNPHGVIRTMYGFIRFFAVKNDSFESLQGTW